MICKGNMTRDAMIGAGIFAGPVASLGSRPHRRSVTNERSIIDASNAHGDGADCRGSAMLVDSPVGERHLTRFPLRQILKLRSRGECKAIPLYFQASC